MSLKKKSNYFLFYIYFFLSMLRESYQFLYGLSTWMNIINLNLKLLYCEDIKININTLPYFGKFVDFNIYIYIYIYIWQISILYDLKNAFPVIEWRFAGESQTYNNTKVYQSKDNWDNLLILVGWHSIPITDESLLIVFYYFM